jgi:hypothetical protein
MAPTARRHALQGGVRAALKSQRGQDEQCEECGATGREESVLRTSDRGKAESGEQRYYSLGQTVSGMSRCDR